MEFININTFESSHKTINRISVGDIIQLENNIKLLIIRIILCHNMPEYSKGRYILEGYIIEPRVGLEDIFKIYCSKSLKNISIPDFDIKNKFISLNEKIKLL